MKPKLAAVLIYAACAFSVIALLRHLPYGVFPDEWATDSERYMQIAVAVSIPVFLFASIRAFFDLRFSYVLGLFAALLPIPWLLHSELVQFRIANSWIALNIPDWVKWERGRGFAEFKILTSVILMMALTYLGLRLLPERWVFRSTPIRQRVWPVILLPALVLSTWYLCSVSPYRVPGAVDGIGSELKILHIVKRGTHFEESVITTQRDRRFYVSQGERHLCQYHFSGTGRMGILSKDVFDQIGALKVNPQLRILPSLPPKRLRDWNSEGWYIAGVGNAWLVLTTENGVTPPKEVVDLFYEIAALPTMSSSGTDARDVCLGFCYDPPAAMGSLFVNQRCRSGPDGLDYCE
jgi:hypothetical protein